MSFPARLTTATVNSLLCANTSHSGLNGRLAHTVCHSSLSTQKQGPETSDESFQRIDLWVGIYISLKAATWLAVVYIKRGLLCSAVTDCFGLWGNKERFHFCSRNQSLAHSATLLDVVPLDQPTPRGQCPVLNQITINLKDKMKHMRP